MHECDVPPKSGPGIPDGGSYMSGYHELYESEVWAGSMDPIRRCLTGVSHGLSQLAVADCRAEFLVKVRGSERLAFEKSYNMDTKTLVSMFRSILGFCWCRGSE